MNKRLIGYSLISAICLGSTATASEPVKEPPGLHVLETHVRQHPSAFSLGELASAYFSSGLYDKGRQTFREAIALAEHGTGIDAGMTPHLLSSWGEAEYSYARDYAEAQRLKLKALSLFDQSTNSLERIEAHRDMVRFYRMCGKQREVDLQTQELARLMGTTDTNVLFPTHKVLGYCPGCGRG
jgi:hypothetical protein